MQFPINMFTVYHSTAVTRGIRIPSSFIKKIFIYWMLFSSSNTSMTLCNQYRLDIIALCMCSGMQTSFMFVSNQVEGELDKTLHPTVGTVQSLFQCKSLIQSKSILNKKCHQKGVVYTRV